MTFFIGDENGSTLIYETENSPGNHQLVTFETHSGGTPPEHSPADSEAANDITLTDEELLKRLENATPNEGTTSSQKIAWDVQNG